MLDRTAKQRFIEIKRRAKERQRQRPVKKSAEDSQFENKTAVELSPYVYKLIREAK